MRFTCGTTAALRTWLRTSVPAAFCLCKPLACEACPGIRKKEIMQGMTSGLPHGQCVTSPVPGIYHKWLGRASPIVLGLKGCHDSTNKTLFIQAVPRNCLNMFLNTFVHWGKTIKRLNEKRRWSMKHLSNPKPGHTTGGSGRAAHSGAAGHGGPGRMGRRRVSPRRAQPSLVSPRASKTIVLNIFLEARTKETLSKPAEEQNPRLTGGLSAVYQGGEKRSLFLAADQWTDAFSSL